MTITKKITLMVTVLAAALLLGSGYVLRISYEGFTLARLRSQAKILSDVVRLAAELALDNYGHLGALEELVSRKTFATVTFFGPDARPVAPTPTQEEQFADSRARRVIERGVPEEETGAGGYAYRVPLRHDGKVAGALELRLPYDAFDQPGDWSFRAAIGAAGLLLVFATLLALYVWRSISRPIAQLMTGMDHLTRGDLTVALPLDRSDEIGRIAYRFNEMTSQLRDAQEQIRTNARARLDLEQRLRHSEKLATIGQLAAEIAHEVGTPLNVIGGRAQTLARKPQDAERVQKNASIIAEQAGRITTIIQQMLDLSRRRTPTLQLVHLRGSLDSALAMLEQQIQQAHITVHNKVPQDLGPIHADADGLQHVFLNLLNNAVQAMANGGDLTVDAELVTRRKGKLEMAAPEPFAVVRITDTGPGIAEALRDQIFDPFFSTKARGEGTGLGLTVAHGVVKEHDGWIEVLDGPDGRGTTFAVHLPVEQPAAKLSRPGRRESAVVLLTALEEEHERTKS